ncbi:MAG: hypothetical protein Q8O56_05780 [Solirubrobacteraceae bacterium]|nr:hypothetical protein [Solirubrobacteraceae bacterium]
MHEASPIDDDLAAATLLLGDGATELVARWLAGRGGAVQALRRKQVLYRPGRMASVVFEGTVEWADRGLRKELLAAAFDRAEDDAIAIWCYPDDPALPGLERLEDPAYVARIGAAAGLRSLVPDLKTLAYRPRRRAVVRARSDRERAVVARAAGQVRVRMDRPALFWKVVRPGRAAALATVHGALGAAAPVPACRFMDDELGLVVLEGLRGDTLRARLRKGSGVVPEPAAIVELLDRLAPAGVAGTPASTTTAKVRRQARMLRAVLPRHAERIDRFVARLGDDAPAPLVTTHGDFHDAQIIVDDAGRVAGLVDLDGVAPGQRIDDLATIVGRVWTAGRTATRGAERFARYGDELFASFAAICDPGELCRRVAGVVFGRATGPFRAQHRDWEARVLERIELAELWLAQAKAGIAPAT